MNYKRVNWVKKIKDNFFNKVTTALCQNNLFPYFLIPSFPSIRHSERSEGATQRICTRVSEAKLVPKTTLLRTVQIQDRRHTEFCIAFHGCKILKQVQDDSIVKTFDKNRRAAFTLAEVLITLGIIGVVAALTIPTLISKYQDIQFKTAYKKAFSDFNQVLLSSMANNEMPYRTNRYDSNATAKEFKIIKAGFKIAKECNNDTFYECWAQGDTVCGGTCSSGNPDDGIDLDNGMPQPYNSGKPFIDMSGRSWVPYFYTENIYLVDTNGLAKPNMFGKDRWIFTLADEKGQRVSVGYPVQVKPYRNTDITTVSSYCKQPPCYYYSWLYKK